MGQECGLRAPAWGRGKRGPDASLAALAGLTVESWSATRGRCILASQGWDGGGAPSEPMTFLELYPRVFGGRRTQRNADGRLCLG